MTTMVKNKVPGADFTEYGLGRKLPAGDRCLAWFELGGSERLCVRNHASNGSRGWLNSAATVLTAGISGGNLETDLANDVLTGDYTLIAFFKPGTAGADLSPSFMAGGGLPPITQTFESTPTRYSQLITARVFSSAPRDVVGQAGTYDSTTPAAAGANNSLTPLITTSGTETVCAVQRFVASTRVHTLKLRNAATFATPSSTTNTAGANHVIDTRTTLPIQIGAIAGTNSIAYSLMLFSASITSAEEDEVYALEKARLTALGVPNL